MRKKSTSHLQNMVFTAIVGSAILIFGQNQIIAQDSGNSNAPQVNVQTDEYFEQGVALFRSKDYKKAIKALEQSLKLNPNNPKTFYILSDAYYNTRQFTKAVKAYQETLRLNPNQSSAKQDLADAQTKMKEEKAAREATWAKLAEAMKNNRSGQSTNAPAPRSNEDKEEGEEANTVQGGVAANSSLPAGKYECRALLGTMLIQGRDSFRINSNGTYQVLNQNNAAAPYSYDSNSGAIQWRGDGFSRASKSWFDADRRLIFIRLGNEVWDCGIRGPQ